MDTNLSLPPSSKIPTLPKTYQSLLDMERKLDWVMTRKKVEVQDSFGRGVSSKIEGRVLERSKDKGPPRKFLTLIKRLVVELDRDPKLYLGSNIVEPRATGSYNPIVDGFTNYININGSQDKDDTRVVHANETPRQPQTDPNHSPSSGVSSMNVIASRKTLNIFQPSLPTQLVRLALEPILRVGSRQASTAQRQRKKTVNRRQHLPIYLLSFFPSRTLDLLRFFGKLIVQSPHITLPGEPSSPSPTGSQPSTSSRRAKTSPHAHTVSPYSTHPKIGEWHSYGDERWFVYQTKG
ncbi:SWI/SNF and RSC complex subunit Ssr3 [Marasmius crinis-equi]|uniref:SWI/SNF and RSC complex subunit Ssr3 n=1 Tax=Marasmius crinis-equi TaxID=585013 RepID=A0ABR3EZ52_9AGAR